MSIIFADTGAVTDTGDIFGAPTQALYFIVSLSVAWQAITGALIC